QLDLEQIKQNLAGRSVNDASAYLVTELPLQSGFVPQISIWPEGFSNMPLLPFRITIQTQDASGS
ncbi:MAG: hypothetical protein J0L63_08465, partial [Anaerolineae bacterium]|nr:hypothetical protein [Anaerolineae bacterium]